MTEAQEPEKASKFYNIAQEYAKKKYNLTLEGKSQIKTDEHGNIILGIRSCPIMVRDPYDKSCFRKGAFLLKKAIHDAICSNGGDYIFILMHHDCPVTDTRMKASTISDGIEWNDDGFACLGWDMVLDISKVMEFFLNAPVYVPIKKEKVEE